MVVYHMSRTLRKGDLLTPDYSRIFHLAEPFLQALERGEACFDVMVLQGKYLYCVLGRSGLREWADYAKYAAEAAFEFVRRQEFPRCCSRLHCAYFYERLQDSWRLFQLDYGNDPEEGKKVRLFAVELDDPEPQYRDMTWFDLAYEAMSERQDTQEVLRLARQYFSGAQTETPVLEILSDRPARAIREEPLRPAGAMQ